MGQNWRSYLENDLSNNSIKSISWQLINIIPKKLYAKHKEKLSDCFWENLFKIFKFDPFLTFQTLKNNIYSNPIKSIFRQFISTLQDHICTVHWYLPKEASYQKRTKVIRPFLRNQHFKWKVDDGRLGISKAPLPSAWRS